MRYCFDLDGTICTQETFYQYASPDLEMVSRIRSLYEAGHTIIIYTARKMSSCSGNAGKAMTLIGKLTLDQLEEWQVPYHEIYFGKPAADIYIDDKAVNVLHWKEV